jgi:hypothetical protein
MGEDRFRQENANGFHGLTQFSYSKHISVVASSYGYF